MRRYVRGFIAFTVFFILTSIGCLAIEYGLAAFILLGCAAVSAWFAIDAFHTANHYEEFDSGEEKPGRED